jgi:hypothetical protein
MHLCGAQVTLMLMHWILGISCFGDNRFLVLKFTNYENLSKTVFFASHLLGATNVSFHIRSAFIFGTGFISVFILSIYLDGKVSGHICLYNMLVWLFSSGILSLVQER